MLGDRVAQKAPGSGRAGQENNATRFVDRRGSR